MKFILYFVYLRWFIRILFYAQTDPIETIYVAIEGDISGLMKAAEEGVDQTKDKLDELGDAGEKSGKKTKRGAALAGAAFGLAAGAAAKLLDVVINIATQAVQMFKNMAAMAVQLAGDFEQVQLTFTNIFGNRAEANAFLKGLQAESAKLGLSFNEASQFAKSLFPDTSGLEQFNELLRVAAVGAADAGLNLSELIFSFNEAVSGDFVSIRDRLDIPRDVIERVKQSDDVVSGLIEELDKLFTKRGVNNLEAAGSTLQGLKRRIAGVKEELLLTAGLEVLGPLREGFQRLLDIIQENRPALDAIATSIGEIAGQVVEFAREEFFSGLDPKGALEGIQNFINRIKAGLGEVKAFVAEVKRFALSLEPLAKMLVIVLVALNPLARAIALLVALLPRLDEALLTGAKGLAIVTAIIEGMKVTILGLNDALGGDVQSLKSVIDGGLGCFQGGIDPG